MDSYDWKKVENEAGYPLYIDNITGNRQYDHPEYLKLMKILQEYDEIKYDAYRIAFKTFALRSQLKVPPLRISSGVFARHQLSLSESSLSLDTAELEAVLADIYFAYEKEGLFNGDVDLNVDLLINLLLNVYDKERKEPIRVLAAKTLLIILSEDLVADKWSALSNCSADHNSCVSQKRLASLLSHVAAAAEYLGSTSHCIQDDVDDCFAQSEGMLGISSRVVAQWGASSCKSTQWLSTVQRIAQARLSDNCNLACSCCGLIMNQMLKFRCSKCSEVYFCEKCYLYEKSLTTVSGHKKNHIIHEIIDGQTKPPECLSFIKGVKRFFFCTKTKRRKATTMKTVRSKPVKADSVRKKNGKPAKIFTSTVGKASGNKENSPTAMLQDIINQLEAQNKAIQDLANQLQEANKSGDEGLKAKVDAHWNQISTQIHRLKILKDNLTSNVADVPQDKVDRPQAFDLFSPILTEEKQSKAGNVKNPPRVLSLDSGNFSVASKNGSKNLLTISGDALKPVTQTTSDSISSVSVNDISLWYNEESQQPVKKPADIAQCEEQYAADNRAVETSNSKMREINADLDTVLDRLHTILAHNFTMDESCFDNTQLRETANEMEGLLGTLIRGVEQRATLNAKSHG